MGEYILAHDLGTSGNKATLFSVSGEMAASVTRSYPIYYDQELWAEQDAGDWWNAVVESTGELIRKSGIRPEEICAMSFSGQMLGALPVDRNGVPLRRAIIWADQRARAESQHLSKRIPDDRVYQIVGHRNMPSYGIQKIMWIRDHEKDIYERASCFLNAKDYIAFKLTGRMATDPSDANGMGCFDQKAGIWSEEILQAADIPKGKLPEIVPSTTVLGNVTPEAAEETGLSTRTKVVMGSGDGLAANVGAGSVTPGSTYVCLGTSAWVASTSDHQILDEKQRMVCWAHAIPGMFSPNGTMQYAGGSYAWLEENLGKWEQEEARKRETGVYGILNEEIKCAPKGADGVIFLPYLLGERAPRWNPDAKGVFFGIKATTTREEMFRSVVEGIAMNLAICFDVLKKDLKIPSVLLIGGGARSSVFQNAIADIFGVPVRIPDHLEEANSMGAAVIAGVGCGLYDSFEGIGQYIHEKKVIEPDKTTREVYQERRKMFEAVYQALIPVFSES